MKNQAFDLFLLTANLSQLKDRDRIITLFVESMHAIYAELVFSWADSPQIGSEHQIEVCTRTGTYGFFNFSGPVTPTETTRALIHNACQMVGVILEKLNQEQLLIEQNRALDVLAGERARLVDKLELRVTERTAALESANNALVASHLEALNTMEAAVEARQLAEKAAVALQQEIIERKQAEAALRESEERFRILFEHLPIPAFTKNREGIYTGCNAENRKYWLINPVGRTDAELLDPETATALREVDLRVMETGDMLTQEEYFASTKLGVCQTISRKVPLRDDDGNIVGVLGASLDITKRKEAEAALRASKEQFEAVVTRAPVPMVITDANQDIILFNDKFIEQFGYTLEDIATAEEWWLTVYPDEIYRQKVRNSWEKAIARAAETGIEIEIQEWDLTLKNGSVRRGEFKMMPLGEISVIIINDITDRIRAEEERLKLRKLESVGVLAGGIAHDFNNLLTGVFGNIEMAKFLLPADHKSHKFLESAGRSMENATRLTGQLLTFAKGGDPIKETLSVGDVIIETAQFLMRGSSAGLQTGIAADLWPVEADKGQLSQVISNLVINAQQAMPTGGTITIAAENIEIPEGRYVQITVQDEGVGIAPQYLDKIFDPYFTTKQHGSGLGLASTHSIINKHNGKITVDSKLNQGTRFTIHLPAAEKANGKAAENQTDQVDTSPASSVHILILDDEEAIREVLGAILKEMGHKVSYAVDGREAIAEYKATCEQGTAYDLFITDLTLPGGMSGREAAQEILKIDPQAKIIVSSGYATDPVMANYKAYGFRGKVTKPYSIETLQKVIRQVLKT